MLVVQVAIVQVIDVVTVRDGNVTTALTMLVVVVSMDRVLFRTVGVATVIPMAFVLVVQVAVVQVVDVVTVRDGDVAAAFAMLVVVVSVNVVHVGALFRQETMFSGRYLGVPGLLSQVVREAYTLEWNPQPLIELT